MTGLGNIHFQQSSSEFIPIEESSQVAVLDPTIRYDIPFRYDSGPIELTDRRVSVSLPKLTLPEIFANRESVLEAFIGAKGAPSPILEAIKGCAEPSSHFKILKLAKACATKADLEKILNYEYDHFFDLARFSTFDRDQKKAFYKARSLVIQIASETQLSIREVLYGLSIVCLKREPVAFSEHVLKLNALRRKANRILKQQDKERISLSNAFLAYKNCIEAFNQRQGIFIGYSDRNLVMLPLELVAFYTHCSSQSSLYFYKCSLTEFPESLMNRSIRNLSLSGNLLTEIPDCFSSCEKLYELSLSDTMISSLPASLLAVPALERLNIKNTALSTIPLALNHLPLITTEDGVEMNALVLIDFSGNGILWKNLSDDEKKVIEKLIELRTEVRGIQLPKHLRLKNKIKDISVKKSIKKKLGLI